VMWLVQQDHQLAPTTYRLSKYVDSHSQLAVFQKKKIFQFGSPVLGLSHQCTPSSNGGLPQMMLLPPSSKHTISTCNTTFSSDASFSSSDLGPFVRFVKTPQMPWLSHDRVTVDYLPDHRLLGAKHVKAKKGKVKRMKMWYRPPRGIVITRRWICWEEEEEEKRGGNGIWMPHLVLRLPS